jgi:exosortase E/protease (VPEID-CTERM system)
LLAFLTAYLWFYRKELRFPAAMMLLPLGAVAAWLANAVRIVALIAIGSAGWRAVAAGGFHSQAGWIAFNLIALGFVALTNRAGYFRRPALSIDESAAMPATPRGDPTTAYLGPFIVVTATAMVTGLFSAGFDWLYPVRLVAVGVFLWVFRKQYLALQWSWSWWSLAIGFVAFLAWIALVPNAPDQNGAWPTVLRSMPIGWAVVWFLFRSVGYVVMTPLAEELAFRGFLTRRLARADFNNLPIAAFSWWALVISSVLFGMLHGARWLPATLAGMSFGFALYRRGVIGEAVWAHATTNGLIALYACATGRWSVWS